MVTFAVCFGLGTLLAQRFRAFILVPSSLLAACFAYAGHGYFPAHSNNVWLAVMSAAAALQAGYLAGLGVRAGLAHRRMRRLAHPLSG
jgi:hypothetical protein